MDTRTFSFKLCVVRSTQTYWSTPLDTPVVSAPQVKHSLCVSHHVYSQTLQTASSNPTGSASARSSYHLLLVFHISSSKPESSFLVSKIADLQPCQCWSEHVSLVSGGPVITTSTTRASWITRPNSRTNKRTILVTYLTHQLIFVHVTPPSTPLHSLRRRVSHFVIDKLCRSYRGRCAVVSGVECVYEYNKRKIHATVWGYWRSQDWPVAPSTTTSPKRKCQCGLVCTADKKSYSTPPPVSCYSTILDHI